MMFQPKLAGVKCGDCALIELPKILDSRGSLTFIENGNHIPFEIKRVYYLYESLFGATRGGHAHKQLKELLIAVSGSFDLMLDDGFHKRRVRLDSPSFGLYIPPMIWLRVENFTRDAVCLALASEFYSEADYYRDYGDFLEAVEKHRSDTSNLR